MIIKPILVLLLQAALALTAQQAYGQQPLRFAVDNRHSDPIPPYSWYNQCKKVHQGFNNALYKKIAADLSLEAKFIEAGLAENTIDMLNQSTALLMENKADFALAPPSFIQQRNQLTAGEKPVTATSPVLILAASQAEITEVKQLEKLNGVGVNSADAVKILKLQNVNINVNKVGSIKEAVMHLARGEQDYWLTDKFIAQYLINDLGLQSKVRISKLKVGTSIGLHIMTNQQPVNQERLQQIDQLLASYHQNGYIEYLKFRVMQSWLANKDCANSAD
ncbi:substrate-binding periplasmic protein [Oceanicoccus sagamiensis]|uniref:Uncharacterized protein n=1 Tax=Oceanicoccus sagamiensis TaxID=716816 RepID=A0A1X9N728_9GAMM|nr:transporter substrate-binding domain-containing protein [Oceanicoccus sagamiensis]ARN72954.1 hypothetical protein BST96_01830 [Oceanicoccus sagamiensis]